MMLARQTRSSGIRKLTAVACLVAWLAPLTAHAGSAEESLVNAQKGAIHFNKGEYLQAALAFERAFQLDAGDAKNLRYAGRAWQEIGHWPRALLLLERYYAVESNPQHRDSILEKLAPLRAATPKAVAEALTGAARRYPEAHIDAEAALAWEKLGNIESLRQATSFWEVARLGAASPGDREQADAGLQRVRGRIVQLEQADVDRRAPPPRPDPPPPAPRDLPKVTPAPLPPAPRPPAPASRSIVPWLVGGVLLAGGGAAALAGNLLAADANQRFDDRKYARFSDYEADKGSADLYYYSGLVALTAGAGTLAWALLAGDPAPAPAAQTSLRLQPWRAGEGAGLALSGGW